MILALEERPMTKTIIRTWVSLSCFLIVWNLILAQKRDWNQNLRKFHLFAPGKSSGTLAYYHFLQFFLWLLKSLTLQTLLPTWNCSNTKKEKQYITISICESNESQENFITAFHCCEVLWGPSSFSFAASLAHIISCMLLPRTPSFVICFLAKLECSSM